MFKYYFIKNKLVYFDIDIAEEFECDVSLIRDIVKEKEDHFLSESVFKIDSKDVYSIQIVQSRIFTSVPQLAFTSSAIFLISIYCGTEKSIKSAKKLLLSIEEKEQFDIVKTINNLSTTVTTDSNISDTIKQIVRMYVMEILSDLKTTPLNVENLIS